MRGGRECRLTEDTAVRVATLIHKVGDSRIVVHNESVNNGSRGWRTGGIFTVAVVDAPVDDLSNATPTSSTSTVLVLRLTGTLLHCELLQGHEILAAVPAPVNGCCSRLEVDAKGIHLR